jgi:hypothetical protein
MNKPGIKCRKKIMFAAAVLAITLVTGMIHTAAQTPEVYPRIFTPENADGKNDAVNFNFESPGTGIGDYLGQIFDLEGRVIAGLEVDMNDSTLRITSTWDGKDENGDYAKSGIYIYQIVVSSKVYNGTIVLAK